MIRVGIIGAGYWGINLIRNFYGLEKADLNIVCDLSDERLSYVKKQYPVPILTKDCDKVFNNPNLDAIVIVLPAKLHYEVAKKSLESNKHTFVEKPLALSSEECIDLIELSEQKNRILMVGHTFEYNAAVNKIKELHDSGEIGDLYYINSQRLNLGRVRRDINAMWNLAPHDISILNYVLDDLPSAVSAKGGVYLQEGVEDIVSMDLEYKDGRYAHVQCSWLNPNKVRKMIFVGSKKMVVYDDTSPDAKVLVYDKGIDKESISEDMGDYSDFGQFQLKKRAGDIWIPKIEFIEPLKVECSHFIDSIASKHTPRSDGNDGLEVVRVLEACQKSLANNGKKIPVSTKETAI